MKSMLGHCMGAASALEAIGCIMTLERGVYPPTIGYETPGPRVRRRRRRQPRPLRRSRHRAQQLLAFGGYNSVTCLARPYKLPEPPPFSRRAA